MYLYFYFYENKSDKFRVEECKAKELENYYKIKHVPHGYHDNLVAKCIINRYIGKTDDGYYVVLTEPNTMLANALFISKFNGLIDSYEEQIAKLQSEVKDMKEIVNLLKNREV